MNTAPAVRPVVTYDCQVVSLIPLTKNTWSIELRSPDGTVLDYYAGQYLKLELDLDNDGQLSSLYYSIANSMNAHEPRRLQLIVQVSSEFSKKVLQHFVEKQKDNTGIATTLPMGQAYLQTDLSKAHVLIAAGSGIAKIKCIVEEMVKQNPQATLTLYWSNRQAEDFFLLDELQDYANQYQNVDFVPILESANTQWTGRSGYIYSVIKEDMSDLSQTMLYLCGSPTMVYGTMDQLKSIGVSEAHCYSDAFEVSPREQALAI